MLSKLGGNGIPPPTTKTGCPHVGDSKLKITSPCNPQCWIGDRGYTLSPTGVRLPRRVLCFSCFAQKESSNVAGKKPVAAPPKKGDKGKGKKKTSPPKSSPPEKDIQHMLDVLVREVGDSPTDRDLDSRGIPREWLTNERMARAKEAARDWFLAQQKKNVDLLWRGPEEIADKDVGNLKRWFASAKDKDVFRVTLKDNEFVVERQSVNGWRFIGTDKQSRKKSLESALDWAEGYFMEDSLGSKRPTKSNKGDILPKKEDKKPTPKASATNGQKCPGSRRNQDGGPSNKEMVYGVWISNPDLTVEEALAIVRKGQVKDLTIRGWLSAWKRGQNLPACAKK